MHRIEKTYIQFLLIDVRINWLSLVSRQIKLVILLIINKRAYKIEEKKSARKATFINKKYI